MLYIKGKKMTEIKPYTIKDLQRLSREGDRLLNTRPNELDSRDVAFIKAANNVLMYSKFQELYPKTNKVEEKFWIELGNAVISDYLALKRSTENIDQIHNTIAERVACVLLFHIWNSDFDKAFSDGGFKAEICLEYGMINAIGAKVFSKIGLKFRIAEADSPTEYLYFDALKLGRAFVNDDLTESSDGEANSAVADMPHFSYQVNKELYRLFKVEDDDLEEPEPFKKHILEK